MPSEPAVGPTSHILVVDDDRRIRQMLAQYFTGEGYRVTTVADGAGMWAEFDADRIDLVLLDVMLPGAEDGYSLARALRSRSDVPIIMLTGRGDVTDRVVGLELGADDYIAKPFHLREVLARVRSLLRRQAMTAAPARASAGHEVCRFDGWMLDIERRELTAANGMQIELSTGEFDMLAVFVRRPGRVMTRDTLMELTRGRTWEAFDRTIDAQISRLRRKLEAAPGGDRLIKSVRGVGYVFAGRIER